MGSESLRNPHYAYTEPLSSIFEPVPAACAVGEVSLLFPQEVGGWKLTSIALPSTHFIHYLCWVEEDILKQIVTLSRKCYSLWYSFKIAPLVNCIILHFLISSYAVRTKWSVLTNTVPDGRQGVSKLRLAPHCKTLKRIQLWTLRYLHLLLPDLVSI